MKIAFVSVAESSLALDYRGLGYYMASSLIRQGIDIDFICPLHRPLYIQKLISFKEKINKLRCRGKSFLRNREKILIKNYAKQISTQVQKSNIDVIFSLGTLPIAFLESQKPIICWSDATFNQLIDFYPEYSNLCDSSIIMGNLIEKNALENSSLVIYSSDWAAKSAVLDYSLSKEKVKVVSFGANINYEVSKNKINKNIQNRSREVCKLIFIGVDWKRKGGNIACEIAEVLNLKGLKTEITIIGCIHSKEKAHLDFIKAYPFINKNTQEGENKFIDLISNSHFLLLPTTADATPHVINEANYLGVPCLSTYVGGLPSMITNDKNGHLFECNSDVSEFSDYIKKMMDNYECYLKLAYSSSREYGRRLNWEVAGKKVKGLIQEYCK